MVNGFSADEFILGLYQTPWETGVGDGGDGGGFSSIFCPPDS
ncbi:MAG: hypothetical protein WA919_00380 [Coleofasciculaceae cyanobacterium]